jgi:hypothetical protein
MVFQNKVNQTIVIQNEALQMTIFALAINGSQYASKFVEASMVY